jgi:hypothetical protein
MIPGLRHNINEICVLLRHDAAYSVNSLPTFQNNPSFLCSRAKKMWPIGCPETSSHNYHYTLRNIQEDRRSNRENLHLDFLIQQLKFTYRPCEETIWSHRKKIKENE